jgi:hypothetical protein
MESWKLQMNVEEHFNDPRTRGEWALSVASLPGRDHTGIVAEAWQIRQRQYRVTTVSRLTDAGYAIVADGPPHALVLLPDAPTEEMWSELRALFDQECDNQHFEERRGRARQ